MKAIRIIACLGAVLVAGDVGAETKGSGSLWDELAQKREGLASLHQEFEVSRATRTEKSTQESTRRMVVDLSGRQWRERLISGSGDYSRIFDGQDQFWVEEGGSEFERTKFKAKADPPKPEIYANDAEWAKAVEKEQRPCGIPQAPHNCVVLEAPLRTWVKGSPSSSSRLVKGVVQVLIDSETGAILSRRSTALIQRTRDAYQTDTALS